MTEEGRGSISGRMVAERAGANNINRRNRPSIVTVKPSKKNELNDLLRGRPGAARPRVTGSTCGVWSQRWAETR